MNTVQLRQSGASGARAMTYERLRARARARGPLHAQGICGGMAGLCWDCQEDGLAYLRAKAESYPPPHEGEGEIEYWERVGGAFLDGWALVAWEQFKKYGVKSK